MGDNKHEATMGRLRSMVETELGVVGSAQGHRDRHKATMQREADRARRALICARPSNRVLQRLAENLYCIIEDVVTGQAGQAKIKKKDIVSKANMNDSSGKSGLLHEQTLRPGLTEPELGKRIDRLTRKSNRRLALAIAAAELGHLCSADVVLRLVAGTPFEMSEEQTIDEELAECLNMLAVAIKGAANRIVTAHDLATYFRTIEGQGVSPFGKGGWVANGSDLWLHDALPKVELASQSLGRAPLNGTWQSENFHEPEAAVVTAWLRTALVLAPLANDRKVRAYLASRTVLKVERSRPMEGKPFNLLLEEIVDLPTAGSFASGRLGRLHLHHTDMQRLPNEHHLPELPEEAWEFREVTADSLRIFCRAPEWGGPRSDELPHALSGFTKSPPELLLGNLERSLHYGRGNGDMQIRLDTLLEEDAKRFSKSLKLWVAAQRARVDDAMFRLSAGDGT
jgi:hypothetical protein